MKVMVMDLMTSSYKGTWMNSDLWRFTPGDLSLDLCQDKMKLSKTNRVIAFIFTYRSEEVVAVASMNYDPIVSRVAEVLGSGKTIKKRDVE